MTTRSKNADSLAGANLGGLDGCLRKAARPLMSGFGVKSALNAVFYWFRVGNLRDKTAIQLMVGCTHAISS